MVKSLGTSLISANAKSYSFAMIQLWHGVSPLREGVETTHLEDGREDSGEHAGRIGEGLDSEDYRDAQLGLSSA